jgi:hypothetical protein
MKSFRPEHLIMTHVKMGQVLKGELDRIERRLFALHSYRHNLCELNMHVHIAAARMGIEAPQERRREAYLRWPGMYWESVESDLIELKGQRSGRK